MSLKESIFNKIEVNSIKTITQFFEHQAQETPDAPALVMDQEQLTYKELNNKVNHIAHLLHQKKISRGDIVGIMMDRSLEMVIAMLSILKCNAAYLPLDPVYPVKRLEYMIYDSGIKIIFVNKDFKKKVKLINSDLDTVYLDKSDSFNTIEKNFEMIGQPQDLAYLIYTSGSTGKPKGIMIENKSVLNFIKGMVEVIDFSPGKRILALTTICFDISVLEILLPLCLGLTVIIAKDNDKINPKLLGELIVNKKIDMLQMTPSHMNALLNHKIYKKCLSNVKEILIGGEAFPRVIYEKIFAVSHAKIYNMYGPTETTIWSTIQEITDPDNINIGKPILNTDVIIVDDNMHVLSQGNKGELCIGGEGLARGYLNKQELTEEVFLPHPLDSSKRIYKTGDLGMINEGQDLEYLGRKDLQIKIRGFRIEIKEIEYNILKLKKIKEAAVVVNKNESLVGFLVADEPVDLIKLKETLSSKLPHYMIPGKMFQIDNLPLTPNGKIDRKKLLDINFSNSNSNGSEEENGNDKFVIDPLCTNLISIIKETLRLDIPVTKINSAEKIINWGITSTSYIQLLVAIENYFDFEFDDKDLVFPDHLCWQDIVQVLNKYLKQ